tara:strand:- start:1115 stop:1813 length:699 start_codon:yes stop_codon:yes gene_type:complete
MSKSAEDRISELEGKIKSRDEDTAKFKQNYNTLYKHMQEAERAAMYYKGQIDSGPPQQAQAEPEVDLSQFTDAGVDPSKIESYIERIVRERIDPRLAQAEKVATDALQQTAGREVDRALQSFKENNPTSGKIMDFERLVLMDASDEIRRRQNIGEPVDDIKKIAVAAARDRVKVYGTQQENLQKENARRREEAKKKAMLPDVFAAAGFEEAPTAPQSAAEAGELLDKLLQSR